MQLLSVKKLTKHYGEKLALQDFSLNVNSGEIVALIGRNGAGKTTLLNSVCGIIFPDSGEVYYKGTDLLKDNSKLSEFGILITGNFFDYLNTVDNLALLMRASGETDKKKIKEKIDEVLKLVDLEAQKKKRVKSFSFGTKQRLGLAQTLLTQTSVLVLDEPFIGLDPLGKEILKKVIIQKARQQEVGILFSSHDLNDVTEICDRVVMIEDGIKVYDDVFNNDKRHCIVLADDTNKTLLEALKSRFSGIAIQATTIEFRSELLSPVMEFIKQNAISIIDMQTKESSLLDGRSWARYMRGLTKP